MLKLPTLESNILHINAINPQGIFTHTVANAISRQVKEILPAILPDMPDYLPASGENPISTKILLASIRQDLAGRGNGHIIFINDQTLTADESYRITIEPYESQIAGKDHILAVHMRSDIIFGSNRFYPFFIREVEDMRSALLEAAHLLIRVDGCYCSLGSGDLVTRERLLTRAEYFNVYQNSEDFISASAVEDAFFS